MPIKTKTKNERVKANKFIEFIKPSCMVHAFVAVLIIFNIEHLLPSAVDQKAYATAIQNTQEAYRQSMRDSLKNMQKIHDVLQTMQSLEHVMPALEANIEEMETRELYALSNEYLADFEALKAQALAEKLQEIDPTAKGPITEPQTQQNDESSEDLSESEMLAKVDDNQRAALEILAQLQSSQNGQGAGVSSGTQNDGGAAMGNGNAGSQGMSEVEQLLVKQQSSQYIEQNAKGKQQDFSEAMRTAYGDNVAYRFDTAEQARELKPQFAPFITSNDFSLPTRSISAASDQSAKWLMINSWYVIGPFDNVARQHINTVFPPENVVDLNAKYLGKNQQILTWRYHQFSKTRITPVGFDEYEIYYAYTQIKSAVAKDIWLAIGSDDQSKLWLNNILVWDSLPQHKGWQINEGFRKVHLKAGTNDILFRLENGQYTGGFSVAMAAVE